MNTLLTPTPVKAMKPAVRASEEERIAAAHLRLLSWILGEPVEQTAQRISPSATSPVPDRH